MRQFEVFVGGYGAEVCWKTLTREQYEYWDGAESGLLDKHILGPSLFDDDDERDAHQAALNNIPEYADLTNRGELEWCDMDDAGREYYCSVSNAWLNVIELTKDEQGDLCDDATVLNIPRLGEYNDVDSLCIRCDHSEELETGKQYLQVLSYEKGTFLSAVVTLNDNQEFDASKLKLRTSRTLNGEEEMIDAIIYDGVELESECPETRGKGIDVYLVDY